MKLRGRDESTKCVESSITLANMIPFLAVFCYLLCCVVSSPITFELAKAQKECFYVLTPEAGCSISYYFAVQESDSNDFLINHEIFGPSDSVNPILERVKERLGEWMVYAEHRGEYAFCFYGGNEHNKIVDFDIDYKCGDEHEANPQWRRNKDQRKLRDTHTDTLQESLKNSVDQIEGQLYLLEQRLNYYDSRIKRNSHTVCSTNRRLATFCLCGILLVLGLGLAQVFALSWISRVSRKHAG